MWTRYLFIKNNTPPLRPSRRAHRHRVPFVILWPAAHGIRVPGLWNNRRRRRRHRFVRSSGNIVPLQNQHNIACSLLRSSPPNCLSYLQTSYTLSRCVLQNRLVIGIVYIVCRTRADTSPLKDALSVDEENIKAIAPPPPCTGLDGRTKNRISLDVSMIGRYSRYCCCLPTSKLFRPLTI